MPIHLHLTEIICKLLRALRYTAFLLCLSPLQLVAQQSGMVAGKVSDQNNNPLELVNITLAGNPAVAITGPDGNYSIQVPASKPVQVIFSFIGYRTDTVTVRVNAGERLRLNHTIISIATELQHVVIEDKQTRTTNLSRINPKTVSALPTASGGIEALLKTLPGVVSNNELSSQYSVRGGNYDENLVYVNDIEIYRPFLVRSGQQEGLSFLNSDLVSSVLFSAGGFEAKYGDKMSSVLDIRYKHPQQFAASATASFLGATAHIEGASHDKRFTYLAGARYKTNQYLLNALETKGSYKPVFLDLQALISYGLGRNTEISVLGYVSSNNYTLIPESRQTRFGTFYTPMQLTMYFDGRESDKYFSRLGAVTITHRPNKNLQAKWIISGYDSRETEAYDVIAQYYLSELRTERDANDSIDVAETKGVGGYLNHARNKLNISVLNVENRYSWTKGNNYAQWGVKYQHEQIDDRIGEWQLIDSAGFSLPQLAQRPGLSGNLSDLKLNYHLATSASLNSNRYSAFAQNTFRMPGDSTDFSLTAGVRAQYWDYNNQLLFSPRVTLTYKPNLQKDILLRFSTGYYFQPPFYRELRNFSGQINPILKAQKSLQAVLGNDWNFEAWGRQFKYVTEIYYKYLWDLVPYEVDNVRIRYAATNNSKGYAYGIEMKVNGEFVKGVESWASLAYMKTEEDILDDYYVKYYNAEGEWIRKGVTDDMVIVDSAVIHPGYIPRPTDQRVTFSLFFQDFLPMDPTFKLNLGLYFGSGLPTGAPGTPFFMHIFRLPSYRRVDIGISKKIIGNETWRPRSGFFRGFKSLWATAEILNLLQVNNTISYNWVRDINNNQYGVPNYLTPRQVNFKIGVEF